MVLKVVLYFYHYFQFPLLGRVTRSKTTTTTPNNRKIRRHNSSESEHEHKSDENHEPASPKIDFKRLKGVFESDVESD
jgi:hypothetical protein